MFIDAMPQVLQWRDEGVETMLAVHASYAELLADRLGETIGRGLADEVAGATVLHRLARALSNDQMTRFLFAPETSSRLLWPNLYDPAAAIAFLVGAAQAERGIAEPSDADAGWTALGDRRVGARGTRQRAGQVPGLAPIDFESPWALGLDLNGVELRLPQSRAPLDAAERRCVLDRLATASECIRESAPPADLLVALFAKVWVVQRDPDAPRSFSSGTSGQFVGRAVLANAHLPTTGIEHIADALVHESIHGLLYMQEQQRPWVFDQALYGGAPRTRSPWTGAALPLRPYMQAAFVWYGLAQFWIRALRADHGVDRAGCAQRLATAVSGFLKDDLVDQLAPYRASVAPELVDAIDTMQAVIRDAASDADLVKAA